MAQILQHRRTTTAGLQSERGSDGEIFVDTNKKTLVVMDGSTLGGTPLAKESQIPTDISDLTDNEGLLGGNGNTGVSPVQTHLELTNTAFFNPVSFTKSDNGDEVDVIVQDAEADTLRETYLEAEAMWVDARDADAANIAPDTRPWDGMSSIDAYPVLMEAGVQTPPAPSNFPPLLNSANQAYTLWQESLATSTGIAITRGVQQGVYNPYRENSWDSDISPTGTLWNVDGWDDLTDIESREYVNFNDAYGGALGINVPGSSAIMYVPSTDLYYAVQWTSWTQGGNGGGFRYTRSEIDLTQLNEGITFADGTVQKTAYSRVKSTASNDRRIEEVVGSSEVSVTEVSYGATQDATIRSTSDSWDFYVDATEDLNALYDDTDSFRYLEFSFDGETTWIPVTFGGGTPGVSYQMVFEDDIDRPVIEGRVVRYRVITGGDPVTWWSKSNLPGGSDDFRGAIIDYHAFTGDATWIGTIHIADDDGDETITHTEVSSGSNSSMNDDLWYVTSEGRIRYRRFDGAARTLKAHWVAKVFYGSQYNDD